MPRARNREPTPERVEEEAQEMEMEMEGVQPLEFSEALTWKPGKAIAVAELLRRLKKLSEELKNMEQEVADRESLVPKAQELASGLLLGHRDKGVRAYALLCIVEMFRLLAPDAPYKSGQLKEIFNLFTSHVVPALGNPSDPYNQQHMDILVSLTNVKSVALITDINGSEHMMLTLFSNCFDVMSGTGPGGEKLPKNLEYHLTSMLCTLIEECTPPPSGVVDIVLAQFLRADPNAISGGGRKGEAKLSEVLLETSPAYNMARSVCNTCAEPMDRAIGQYFSSVLIDASDTFSTTKASRAKGRKRTHAESEDESDDGSLMPSAEADLQEVGKAHRLLRELWRSSPDVIQNVVPQLEAEVEGENVDLRTLAVQTIGDMCAGIGAAGPPPVTPMDPAAYPSQSLDSYTSPAPTQNVMLLPAAPHAFSSVYPSVYAHFATRYKDKAVSVRSAFASAVGRILITSGGGKGLDVAEEESLLKNLSDLLQDQDERVRLAAVQTIAHFEFQAVLQKLGQNGGIADAGSPLCSLADRIKDPKRAVRNAAIETLGRIWGVAAGAIAEGNELIRQRLGPIPNKILDAMYLNNADVNAFIYRTLYETLLPVTYPPIKSKPTDSQRVIDSQPNAEQMNDPDALRAERILVLVRDLEDRVQKAWKALQAKQMTEKARYMEAYLKTSEAIQASKDDQKDTAKRFDTVIKALAGFSTDPELAAEHLRKFAKHHDRRSFQLMRFCWSPDSDYRKIQKSMKELTKRMEEAQGNMAPVLETLLPLLRLAATLVYNRSHVHAIVEISRTNGKGLGAAAQDVLKEIATCAPNTFKAHVHELCETLKKKTPWNETEADATIVETLKACASFARRYPGEMPKDRDFYKAMVSFATQSSLPKASKHAVTVIVASAERRDMHIKEIKKACIDEFKYGTPGYVAKLAAISQLKLLASKDCEDKAERILEIVADEVLGQVRNVADAEEPEWKSEIDEDLDAKLWSLKVLVNGLRGFTPDDATDNPDENIRSEARPVYSLLNTLIDQDGELAKDAASPSTYKAHLRLAAAKLILKLSCNRKFDTLMLTPTDFVRLSKVAQDPLPEVRSGFVDALKKYLASKALPSRFYPLVFLYAFEPNKVTKLSTMTWLRSRAVMSEKQQDTSVEASFARFLSLLAHHQDFGKSATELEDFVDYILFYLKTAASQTNLPRIYYLAQRLKAVQDAIDPSKSENLYILSDIAEAVVRLYAEAQNWSLQIAAAKGGLPSGLFARMPSHAEGQRVAQTRFIPEELEDKLEEMVKKSLKTKKRKSDPMSTSAAKRAKREGSERPKRAPATKRGPKPAKTPKRHVADPVPSSDRRKSTRASGVRTYAEHDDSEDDEELEQWQEGENDGDSEANKENVESTPPTSDPMPAPVPAPPGDEVRKDRAKTRARNGESRSAPSHKKAATRQVPVRSGRATRGQQKKVERDVMSVPSDGDEEMIDADGGAEIEP